MIEPVTELGSEPGSPAYIFQSLCLVCPYSREQWEITGKPNQKGRSWTLYTTDGQQKRITLWVAGPHGSNQVSQAYASLLWVMLRA